MKLFNTVISAYYTTKSCTADFIRKQDGVTALEYAIVAAGVASVVLMIFKSDGSFGTALNNVFGNISTKISNLVADNSTAPTGGGGGGGGTNPTGT